MGSHTDVEYVHADLFPGDESAIRCRTVAIRRARKEHLCYGLSGKLDHVIKPGERYRYERAYVENSFWGEYRTCLPCLDKFFTGDY